MGRVPTTRTYFIVKLNSWKMKKENQIVGKRFPEDFINVHKKIPHFTKSTGMPIYIKK